MSTAPGSFFWLVAHDVRLNWRRFAGMLGEAGKARPVVIATVAIVVSHLLAWPVACWLAPIADQVMVEGTGRAGGVVNPVMAGTLSSIVISMFCWMIAQSLFGTMRALYDRGDLDLLMGSPLSASRIFAAKAVAIVGSTIGSLAVLLLPLVNAGAISGQPRWLAAYPLLLSLGLMATAIALLLGMGLFFLLGARRARLVMQLTGAAIGGGFVLAAQIVLMLPDELQARVVAWLSARGSEGSVMSAILGIPVAAALGRPAAMAIMLVTGGLLFALAVALLSDRFAKASLAASGIGSERAMASGQRTARFRSRPGPALRRKEWRLLLRDPGLFAQVSLQIIYTLPLTLVLLKSGTISVGLAVSPSLVVITAQVAASLAWITVSGEDAPELIATAPMAPNAVDRAKLMAIAVPVLIMLAIPAAALAFVSPWAAVVAMALAAGASASTALLNIWHPMPGNRRGMLRRHSQSKVLALVEHIIAVLWAVAAVLALLGLKLFAVPIILACCVLAIASPMRGRFEALRGRFLQRSRIRTAITQAPAAPGA